MEKSGSATLGNLNIAFWGGEDAQFAHDFATEEQGAVWIFYRFAGVGFCAALSWILHSSLCGRTKHESDHGENWVRNLRRFETLEASRASASGVIRVHFGCDVFVPDVDLVDLLELLDGVFLLAHLFEDQAQLVDQLFFLIVEYRLLL